MKWLALRFGGQRWAVHVVAPRSKHLVDESGDAKVAMCFFETCSIYLSSALEESAREDALLHELLHALLYVSGAESAYGGDPKREEGLVTALTPLLHGALKDLGFRFPKGIRQ